MSKKSSGAAFHILQQIKEKNGHCGIGVNSHNNGGYKVIEIKELDNAYVTVVVAQGATVHIMLNAIETISELNSAN